MADVKTEQEPSIEEILESIRQIISEDTDNTPKPSGPGVDLSVKEEPKSSGPGVDLSVKEEPKFSGPGVDLSVKDEPKPSGPGVDLSVSASAAADKAVPLDLTEKVEPAAESSLDLSQTAETSQSSMIIEMMDSPMTDETNGLISPQMADAAADTLSKLLATNVAVEKEEAGRTGKVTLEDIARDLMRPAIKAWIDQNLPDIIERAVQKEVEKLSRRAIDR